jgi:hypothetical protein
MGCWLREAKKVIICIRFRRYCSRSKLCPATVAIQQQLLRSSESARQLFGAALAEDPLRARSATDVSESAVFRSPHPSLNSTSGAPKKRPQRRALRPSNATRIRPDATCYWLSSPPEDELDGCPHDGAGLEGA